MWQLDSYELNSMDMNDDKLVDCPMWILKAYDEATFHHGPKKIKNKN